MTQGAPAALQGADRFHLLKNLAEVLERFCATQSAALKAVDRAHHQALGKALVAPSAPPTAQPQLAQQRRARRLANYEPVQQLRQQGYQVLELAHHLSMGERTVFTDLAAPSFPEWQPYPQRRSRHSILTPYKPYLLEQGNAGQHQTKQLFEDIQQQGYQGTDKTVAQYIHQRRQDQRQPLNTLEGRGSAPAMIAWQPPPLSARRAAWLVLPPPRLPKVEDASLLIELQQQPDLAAAIQLTQHFAQIVRQRQPEQLDRWLARANQSSIKQFQNFASGLQEDYAAVQAGVTLAVSNGPVEGQINRLKLLKRQMYGRAGFDLLPKRVLLAS